MMMLSDPSEIANMNSQPIQTKQSQRLQKFWIEVNNETKNEHAFKSFKLPLARIKKIMKLDKDVKMISQEAPVLFAKACEIFIRELTLRAWLQTEENKRKTLQRNDIASAISKTDMFDFLIDIVPRDDIKLSKKLDEQRPSPELQQYYYQLHQQMPERVDLMYYQLQQQQQHYSRYLAQQQAQLAYQNTTDHTQQQQQHHNDNQHHSHENQHQHQHQHHQDYHQ